MKVSGVSYFRQYTCIPNFVLRLKKDTKIRIRILEQMRCTCAIPSPLVQLYSLHFQDKAYESWRKGCDAANAPDAKACFNAALLDNLDPDTKIGGLQGFKNSEKFYKRSTEPDKLKVSKLSDLSSQFRTAQNGRCSFLYRALLIVF